jgi:Ser/Thr protein kinase RdoA (MazF antagonist)
MSPEWNAATAFDLGSTVTDVRPHGRGLINDTFLVSLAGTPARHAILQRLNRRVFPQPGPLMENLRTLLGHVARRQTPGGRDLRLPAIYPARDGHDYFVDPQGDTWRALGFIENTRSLDSVRDARTAEKIGYALGRFHELTRDLDIQRLHVTRPGFHDTPRYFARFREASVQAPGQGRDNLLDECLAFAESRHAIVSVLEEARRQGALPLRVVHGDPKLDNILFDTVTGEAVGLVDLDTVQPGLLHYDLGDCLRSCCNPAGESPPDPAEAHFDLGLCSAILSRYFAETRGFLTADDTRLLPDAIRLIPFELGLRFLTDHLEGDRYFKIERPGHNLWRARVQFRLVESIERQAGDIDALVKGLARA